MKKTVFILVLAAIALNVSAFAATNRLGSIRSSQYVVTSEDDPTVPSWAKQPDPPQTGLSPSAVTNVAEAVVTPATNELNSILRQELVPGHFDDGQWTVGGGFPIVAPSLTCDNITLTEKWELAIVAHGEPLTYYLGRNYTTLAATVSATSAVYYASCSAATNAATAVVAATRTAYATTNAIVSLNQSVQYVVANGTPLAIVAPAPETGGIRDWLVYVYASADTPIDLSALPGILAADASATNAAKANAVTMLAFTEMTNGVYVIGRQELETLK